MAIKVPDEKNGCTFLWKIENISHCWLTKGDIIKSPSFIADELEGTKWLLEVKFTVQNIITFHLLRMGDLQGRYEIDVNFQLALLDKDGNALRETKTILNGKFQTDDYAECMSETRKRIFVTEREAFLPEDILTIQCTLWKKEATIVRSKKLSARTVFNVCRRSFVWKIDEFSKLPPGVRNKFKDDLIDIDIVFNEGLDFEKKLIINGIKFQESIKYFSFKTSIIDSEGEKKDCGRHEYFGDDLKRGLLSTLLFTKKLIENKSRYLPNDVLSLDCEYVYATGKVLYQFHGCGVISPKVAEDGRNEQSVAQLTIELPSVLAKDLKSMYSDGILCDTMLRTPTKTFPAHKNILSARSSVFRRMFRSDIKANGDHVNIIDLEEETVYRMLLYIYTDFLNDLQLEDACKLYVAAEKYGILSLRCKCSSFLKDNLCSGKACDILLLADRHQDHNLKTSVQDFIVKHDKEVFGSQKWKHLMASNIQLAADVMYQKVFPH